MTDKTSETEHINEMLEVIMKVARGDYSVQVELSGDDDEFDSLAMGLNMMIDDIRTSEEEMRIKDSAIATSINAIAIGDLEGNLTYVNPSFLRMWSYDAEKEILGKVATSFWEEEGKAEEIIKALQERGGWRGEITAKRKGGSTFTAELSSSMLIDKAGKPIGMLGSFIDITERKQSERRLEHLNLVLSAIRNVNQLIAGEKDRGRLLEGACKNLTETRGYHNAWIALLDESGKLTEYARSGLGKDFLPMVERLKQGKLPACGQRALKQPEAVVTEDPALTCTDCPLSGSYAGRGGMTVCLKHGGKVYGLLVVSIPFEMITDTEELGLFREVADDIAFALHDIEMEEQRRRLEHDVAERVKELSCLYGVARIAESPGLTVAETHQEVVKILPASWQYPEITCARITAGDGEFKTANYRETDWRQSSAIRVKGDVAGYVEVGYLEEKPALDEGPFLKEERRLIDAVAEQLGRITEHKQAEEALRHSEERFRTIFDTANDGILLADLENQKFHIGNTVICQMLGYSLEEIKNLGVMDIHPEEDLPYVLEQFGRQAKGDITLATDIPVKRKDGSVFYADINSAPITLTGRAYMLGTFRDITERKKAEEVLRESEEQYRSIVNLSGEVGEVVLMLQDTDRGEGIQAFVSDAWPHITGYSHEELIGMSFFNLVHPKDREASQERHRSKMKGKVIPGLFEMTIIRKDGPEVPVELTSAYTTYKGRHANVVYIRDVTEHKKTEEKIRASLAEKELLLKEVHHRVKNNMQVISSLLKLQSGFVRNKEDATMFHESQNRIQSMALVYNKLYQAEDLAHIDFREYVRELVSGLAHSYKAVSGKVTTSVEVGDVPLGIDHAIPCGLVINELITNSLKHAFPKGGDGEIRVFLGESEGEVELTVSDDGVGIPASLDLAGSKTLGLRLVGNLVEQLGGKIELDRTAGARFRITFRKSQE